MWEVSPNDRLPGIKEKNRKRKLCVCVCVCVCKKRERERERETEPTVMRLLVNPIPSSSHLWVKIFLSPPESLQGLIQFSQSKRLLISNSFLSHTNFNIKESSGSKGRASSWQDQTLLSVMLSSAILQVIILSFSDGSHFSSNLLISCQIIWAAVCAVS